MRIALLAYRKLKRKTKKKLLGIHRQELLRNVKGGDALHLEGEVRVIHPENLTLGRNVHIGADAYINCRGGVTIGDHSILSRRVTIYSYDHNFKTPRCLPFDDQVTLKPVHIGHYVWIGMGVTIAPGTRIGDGAVVGTGTVVSGNIPDNAIVVSPPPRIVGYRDKDHADKLALEERFWEGYWNRERR